MNPLQNFLQRFEKILSFPGHTKKQVIDIISRVSGITLTEKELEVHHGKVHLNTSPGIKNALFMRKQAILKELEALLEKKAPRDMR